MEMQESHDPVNRDGKEEYDDPLYNEIVDFAIETGKISASLNQRRFRLGYIVQLVLSIFWRSVV